MILPIVKVPNTVLTTPSKKVLKIDNRTQKLIDDMKETLIAAKDPEGVGLAAPQVGVNLQIFVIRPTKKSALRTFINPEIIKKENKATELDEDDQMSLEGCLSIDNVWAPVERPLKVQLRFMDENGEIKEEWFEDFNAIIVQHETDHLKGILFTQRALEQDAMLYEEKNGKLREVGI